MSTCYCMGPQNGEPLCPCQMRAARQHLNVPTAPPWLRTQRSSGRPHLQSVDRMPEGLARLRPLLRRSADGYPLGQGGMGSARRAQAHQRGELEALPLGQGARGDRRAPARVLRLAGGRVRQSSSASNGGLICSPDRARRTRLAAADQAAREHRQDARRLGATKFPSNVWLGTTARIKNTTTAAGDPAQHSGAVRFISYEPAIGPLVDHR
jgi:hypothetical protein